MMIHNLVKQISLTFFSIYFACSSAFAVTSSPTPTLAQQQAAQKAAQQAAQKATVESAKAAAARAIAAKAVVMANMAKTVSTAVPNSKSVTAVSTKPATKSTESSLSKNSSGNSKSLTTTAFAKVEAAPVIPGFGKKGVEFPSTSGPTDSNNYLTASPTSSQ